MTKMTLLPNFLKILFNFIIGILLAFLTFFALWGMISAYAIENFELDITTLNLGVGILWIINYFAAFFIVGFLTSKFPKQKIWQIIWLAVPTTILLFFHASISDAPGGITIQDSIFRILSVLSPIAGILLGRYLFLKQPNKN